MNNFNAPVLQRSAAAWRSLARQAAMASCIAVVAGCAHSPCPPFRAAWYVDLPDVGSKTATAVAPAASAASAASAPAAAASAEAAPTIHLALLNDSTQAYRVEKILLNPGGTDSGGVNVIQGKEVPNEAWKPGRLFLVKLESSELSECHLPVAVQIHCGNGLSSPQAVSGLLPNYLPKYWLDRCVQPDIGAAKSDPATVTQ